MKKNLLILFIFTFIALGCNDEDFLDRDPNSILTDAQLWKDKKQVLSLLGNLYGRYYDFSTLEDWASFADFNEAFPSEAGRYWMVQNNGWGYGDWGTWDYGYIRELNLFIERCTAADQLNQADRDRFLAEARFLRASYYFELVKRMGGVPLILKSETYDFSGDPTYLRHPRAKESEIYDFVISEAEEIKNMLPADAGIKSRATKAAALAMEARAALYAGSIARYGTSTPQVSLSGGEVGIPVAMAQGYYQTALKAAEEIIKGNAGNYSLYKKKPDLSENFASIFYDKSNNPEAIFVEDYKLKTAKIHTFTVRTQPRYGAEEEEGGRLNPTLNLVQSFEKLDNTYAPFNTNAYYTNLTDIFADRDARLAGTVILPGTSFKGRPVDIWAGYLLEDGSIVSGSERGQQKTLPGTTTPRQVVGFDGPIDGYEFTAQTGFYLRKYLDPAAGSGQRGTQSEVWFIRYRYAEVLLNAAEAAFELNDPGKAAGYLNQVRERAGLTTGLTAGQVNFDRIVHERKVELAFEGLYFFDMKRWRLAHIIWDGNAMSVADLTSNIGEADKHQTQPYGLWPYKVFDPGDVNDGKWKYRIVLPNRVTGADRFQLGNYYSEINNEIRSNNPLIVKNPNQ